MWEKPVMWVVGFAAASIHTFGQLKWSEMIYRRDSLIQTSEEN